MGNHNSGRKSFRDEKLRTQVIQKAWEKKAKRLSDSDAIQIVLKDMVVKGEIKTNVSIVFDEAFNDTSIAPRETTDDSRVEGEIQSDSRREEKWENDAGG